MGVSIDMLFMPVQTTRFILRSWLYVWTAPKPPDVDYRSVHI